MAITLDALFSQYQKTKSMQEVVQWATEQFPYCPETPKPPYSYIEGADISEIDRRVYAVFLISSHADLARYEQAVAEYQKEAETYGIRLDAYNKAKAKDEGTLLNFIILKSNVSSTPREYQDKLIQAAKLLSNGDFVLFHNTLDTICSVFDIGNWVTTKNKRKDKNPTEPPTQLDSSPNLAATKLAEMVVQVLDKKCRNGCSPNNYKWDGFQNGNGTECGVDIERLINKAKKFLRHTERICKYVSNEFHIPNPIKFRLHRGGFRASMDTTQEFKCIADLKQHLTSLLPDTTQKVAQIKFEHVGIDSRNGWDTYYVSQRIEGEDDFKIVGMSDGILC